MKKLKVLISAYACNPAGSPHLHPGEDLVGWNLVQQLKKNHELWVITHDYNRPEIQRGLKGSDPKGLHFVYVKLPLFVRLLYRVGFGERIYYYLWQIAAWRTAVRLHRKHHFNLAHHLTFGNYWMPSFIGAFLPVPFIWGPIGGGQKIPRVFMKEFSYTEKLSEYGRDAAQWIGRYLLISRKICMRRAQSILVCNRETKAMFPCKYWPKIQYFPVNGISRQELAPISSTRARGKTLRFITAGRFIRLKGFDIILRAFAAFQNTGIQAELVIVGQGPKEADLRSLAERLNLSGGVRFLTWLSRDELLKRMRGSDVFLFSSLRDGGGAVVVEAMASGIPVICLNLGGPGFHIRKEWGVKISSGQPDDVIKGFSQAMVRLAGDLSERRTLGKAGRTRTQEFYVWDKLGERMEDIYRKVYNDNHLLATSE
jgi:glycosyltransferase involved in cell wall biosynthesis